MRIDTIVAYVVTGIFVLATLIVGAELPYSTSVAIEQATRALLNTDRTPAEWRTKIHSNVLTAIIALAFVALCANAVRKAVSGSGG